VPEGRIAGEPRRLRRRDGDVIPQQESEHPGATMKLTPKQQRFVDEYLIDLNATKAAIRAGYSAHRANAIGYENLTKPYIAAAIEQEMKARTERTEITQDMVLRRYWEIATANPNELVQFRRVCCRHCFGKDHAYQWVDAAEYERAMAHELRQAEEEDRAANLPSDEGGYGFDRTLRPHPKCPKCQGEGFGEVFANDTRDVSPAALALYAGVKQTKEGFEVKLNDQVAALRDVARHLNMFKEKVELTGKDGGPLEVKSLSPIERANRVKMLIEQAEQRRKAAGAKGDGPGIV
jgi:phage terminase small subunit